jgi:hypothetical protein
MTTDRCAVCFEADLPLWWARVPPPAGWAVKVCVTCYTKHCEPTESASISEEKEDAPEGKSRRIA